MRIYQGSICIEVIKIIKKVMDTEIQKLCFYEKRKESCNVCEIIVFNDQYFFKKNF